MTEKQAKNICKYLVDFGNHDFTELEKELLKQAIDQSRNWQELFAVAIASKLLDQS